MGATIDRRSLLRAGVVLAGSGAVAVTGHAAAGAQPARETGAPRVSVGFVVGRATIGEGGGSVRVRVPVLSKGRSMAFLHEAGVVVSNGSLPSEFWWVDVRRPVRFIR